MMLHLGTLLLLSWMVATLAGQLPIRVVMPMLPLVRTEMRLCLSLLLFIVAMVAFSMLPRVMRQTKPVGVLFGPSLLGSTLYSSLLTVIMDGAAAPDTTDFGPKSAPKSAPDTAS